MTEEHLFCNSDSSAVYSNRPQDEQFNENFESNSPSYYHEMKLNDDVFETKTEQETVNAYDICHDMNEFQNDEMISGESVHFENHSLPIDEDFTIKDDDHPEEEPPQVDDNHENENVEINLNLQHHELDSEHDEEKEDTEKRGSPISSPDESISRDKTDEHNSDTIEEKKRPRKDDGFRPRYHSKIQFDVRDMSYEEYKLRHYAEEREIMWNKILLNAAAQNQMQNVGNVNVMANAGISLMNPMQMQMPPQMMQMMGGGGVGMMPQGMMNPGMMNAGMIPQLNMMTGQAHFQPGHMMMPVMGTAVQGSMNMMQQQSSGGMMGGNINVNAYGQQQQAQQQQQSFGGFSQGGGQGQQQQGRAGGGGGGGNMNRGSNISGQGQGQGQVQNSGVYGRGGGDGGRRGGFRSGSAGGFRGGRT